MIKKIAAMIAFSSLAWGTTRLENAPFLTSGYDEEEMRYIFRFLEAIDGGSIDIIGDENIIKDETNEWIPELYACVDAAFQERGLKSTVWEEDYYPDPASIVTNLYFQGKAILVEVRLVEEACLRRSHACIPAVIWEEQKLIHANSLLEAKSTILSYMKTFTGKILDIYLEAKKNPDLHLSLREKS